ncbi:hypothetical protein J32TS6_19980 [Virgibacillus pantothenticus]|jgi:Family of unknown function (DUF5344)|uniref:Uncharacterized protein n=1 Tax=Virgibacillus pantothenticus TaxID=1473 RepID=A0A0L0QK81_VIRPA|nr:DUF5344 family protein [Virgibacillus pantothenticus]KNE18976.1 hypothetical protein AFK71_10385 [Virgibacillus pantothenticus]MBU8565274.1 YwqI/YxiC family protein [Virgibacillus pantothenticus]MBU8599507.1 YwqI/YxiC family protein [Virgibacillus pantothenticus]MBU8633593.1 YwqI/YxiC family protein [Virgibacillus pantothenticus]MBU8641787.1 YwqI/YxiC family protein [Virgibacillus pantothenticus]
MSEEIKIAHGPIQKTITKLEMTTQQLNSDMTSGYVGENTLDMTKKLEELNHLLEDVLASYQVMLLEHGKSTMDAVDQFIESEQSIASSIQFIK